MDDSILVGLIENCAKGGDDCRKAVRSFLQELCPDRGLCIEPVGRREKLIERYSWVESIIKRGVPDGRSRMILYIISRYLVNVKGLELDEALLMVKEFLSNSCKNYGNCSKIYESWIRNVLRSVKRGGWLPWRLDTIKDRDPELYDIIMSILEK